MAARPLDFKAAFFIICSCYTVKKTVTYLMFKIMDKEFKQQLLDMKSKLEQQLEFTRSVKRSMELSIFSISDRFGDPETFCRVFLQTIQDVRNIQADLFRIENQLKVFEK